MSRRTVRATGRAARVKESTAPVQGGLWGDDVPVPPPSANVTGTPAGTNDVERWARVLATAADPGLMVTQGRRGARRVMARVPGSAADGTAEHVTALPAADAAVVLQALAAGHVQLGTGARPVRHGRYEGPAVRVLVPSRTRSLLARWAALRPLSED